MSHWSPSTKVEGISARYHDLREQKRCSSASSAGKEALDDNITEEYKHSVASSGMDGPKAVEYDSEESGCHGETHPPSRLPILRSPIDRSDGPWLADGHIASPWLSLFYDLAMVAVLTVFSTTHELATPASIPTFLSYFVVIYWIWTSQVHYDIRYQAEDAFHWIAKSLQIAALIYIGAASGNWNLSLLKRPDLSEVSRKVAAEYDRAEESFFTVVLAFLASRVILLIQYIVSMILGYRARRGTASHRLAAGFLLVSIVQSTICLALPLQNFHAAFAKVALLYSAILGEIIGLWIQTKLSASRHIDTTALVERYGALTLIILGEGFISLTRAFNRAISGLSDTDAATYAQVFIAIAIIFLVYLFLFGHRGRGSVKRHHVLFWEAVHFPLHVALLLLLAAMVNTIVVISFAAGISRVTTEFSLSLEAIANGTGLHDVYGSSISRYLDKLILEPDYETEFDLLNTLSAMESPPDSATILAYQYFGQIILQTTISYGIEVQDDAMRSLENLYSINVTVPSNTSLLDQRRAEAQAYLIEVVEGPVDDALSGVLWLCPCAGAVLALAAARSLLSTHPLRLKHALTFLPMILAGIALSLLGLLDIGKRNIDIFNTDELSGTNTLYRLLEARLPLFIVMMVYLGVYAISTVTSWLLHRSARRSQERIGNSA